MATPEQIRAEINRVNQAINSQKAANAKTTGGSQAPTSYQETLQLYKQKQLEWQQKSQEAVKQTNAKLNYQSSPEGIAAKAKADAAEAARLQTVLQQAKDELARNTPAEKGGRAFEAKPPTTTPEVPPPTTVNVPPPTAGGIAGGAAIGAGVGEAVAGGASAVGSGAVVGGEGGSVAGPVGAVVGAVAVGALALGLALLQKNRKDDPALNGASSSSANLFNALGGLYPVNKNAKIQDNSRGFDGGQVPDAEYIVHYDSRNWDNWVSQTEATSKSEVVDHTRQARGPIGQFFFQYDSTDHYWQWNGDIKVWRGYLTTGSGTSYWGNSWNLENGDYLRVTRVERVDGSSPEHDKIQSDLYTGTPTNDHDFNFGTAGKYTLDLSGFEGITPKNDHYPPPTTTKSPSPIPKGKTTNPTTNPDGTIKPEGEPDPPPIYIPSTIVLPDLGLELGGDAAGSPYTLPGGTGTSSITGGDGTTSGGSLSPNGLDFLPGVPLIAPGTPVSGDTPTTKIAEDLKPPIPPTQAPAPNGCSCNGPILSGQQNILDKLNTGLQGIDLTLLGTINNKLGDQLPGGIGGFMKKAFEFTKADKIINILTLAMATHNAAMVSRDLGSTIGDVASLILNQLPIVKDATGGNLDVNEVIGKSVTNLIKGIIGNDVYNGVSDKWNKANRVITAATGAATALQSMAYSTIQGVETVGGWLAKMGNKMQEQGIVDDDSWDWMNEHPNFKSPYGKLLETVESLDDAANSLSTLVSSGIEVQQAYTDTVTATTELTTALSDFNTTKKADDTTKSAESQSPDITNYDLIETAPEDN